MGSSHPAGPIRLFPSPGRTQEKISVPLTILDATCARFTDTGAVWLFDAPSAGQGLKEDMIVDRLRSSFITTLDDFPQWAGQLHWAPFWPEIGNHTERWQRCMLTYGGINDDCDDPGVEWSVVRRNYALDSIAPSSSSSRSNDVWWDNDAFPQQELISPTNLALANLKDWQGLPCMSVQITMFTCGGYGVGVRLAHPIADAQSMMVFMHKWAANCRSAQQQTPSSSLFGEPVFDPPRLDARAVGDIDSADGPDPELCAKARALPMHRFSWWDMDAPGYSPYLVGKTKNNMPPADVLAKTTLSPSTTAPWHTWDLARPAASVILHFTGEELSRLRERARAETTANGDSDNSSISRSDALLAHLFRLVTQARCSVKSSSYAPGADDEVFLNYTLEARRRVEPPLPETFLGSPLFMTHIKAPAASILLSQPETQRAPNGLTNGATTTTTGALARQLRKTLQQFTPDAVAALLHESTFEVAPQRLWRGFLGPRHVIVTSWLRTRLYDVDFGFASAGESQDQDEGGSRRRRPRYVHAVMDKADGILVLLDPVVDDGGVDVAVYLDAEAMGELRELVKTTPI
ncbi:transferase family protein [Apiospora rasikravindrae]|uniref:Transferase family protein n=1 Tax=Apiospora rasikravindrae TaxID=990691 RepID=A0ABR1SZY8_9PEZI